MNGTAHTIVISGGRARAIYHDDLRPVMAKMGGGISVTRASHVEPGTPYGYPADRWVADMSPSGGPILVGPSGTGYETREAALAAEHDWLSAELGL